MTDPHRAAPPHDTPLTLLTLGGGVLQCQDGSRRLSAGKPLALITYLACAPRRRASRDHLLDVLWADLTPDRARHALRQLLWYLRQVLGPAAIDAEDNELTLRLPLAVDRDWFLTAIECGDTARAVDLYRGDFLEGFAAPGGIGFEHWAEVERQHLRAHFHRAATAIVREQVGTGRFREAADLARRLRDGDPLNEASWRRLLEVLIAAGDTVGSHLEAAALRAMLANELRDPEPGTAALLARLDVVPAMAGAVEEGLAPALVGREDQFGVITGAYQRVRAGSGCHVHVSAPPGLGKTRLLLEARNRLRALGARVVVLRAHPGDRHFHYGFAAELVRVLAELPGAAAVSPAAASALVALAPALAARYSAEMDLSTGGEAHRRRALALTELLTAIGDEHPCALLLDDLHWADALSLQLLGPVIDRMAHVHLLLVTTARPVPQAMAAGHQSRLLTLAPLTAEQVAELVASLGELPPMAWSGDFPGALCEATGGSPLLIIETLQLLMDQEVLRLRNGQWLTSSPEGLAAQLTATAGRALTRRLDRVDQLDRAVLLLLALEGAPLAPAQLSAALKQAPDAVDAALATLEQRALAQRAGEAWQPIHDEVAEALLDQAAPAERQQAHAALGAMFADGPATLASLMRAARHLYANADWRSLQRTYDRYLTLARQAGDGRRSLDLARDLLRLTEAPLAAATRLVSSQPYWSRLRRSSAFPAWRLGIVVVLVLAVGLALYPVVPQAEAKLLVLEADTAGAVAAWRVDLRRAGWVADSPLALQRDGSRVGLPPVLQPDSAIAGPPLQLSRALPDRQGGWYWSGTAGRSEDIEVFHLSRDRQVRRLTASLRDDNVEDLAPDGRWLLLTTARWSPPGADDYDLALLDPANGALRRLTHTPDADDAPVWSPDGQRIAFRRLWKTLDRDWSLCWMPPDGQVEPECRTLDGGIRPAAIYGWLDARRLLFLADSAGDQFLAVARPGEVAVQRIGPRADFARPSPDRQWSVLRTERPGSLRLQWRVAFGHRGLTSRELRPSAPGRSVVGAAWIEDGRPDAYLDSLRFVDPPAALVLGVSHRLRVRGADARGRDIELTAPLTWRVQDSTIVRVVGSGVLRAARPGRTKVYVTIPGWRGDSLAVEVTGATPSVVLHETWDHEWHARWRSLGTPAPQVVRGPGGIRGFWNRGDGVYMSGAHTARSFPAAEGLGVEVMASTPVNSLQWQRWALLLDGTHSDRRDSTVNPERGDSPSGSDLTERTCGFYYPAEEGRRGMGMVRLGPGGSERTLPVGRWIRAGEWYRVRIQILPDGRCGLAVNGVPVWLGPIPLKLDRPFRPLIGTAAAGARILHGPLEVWTGVRTDIDWSVLDSVTSRQAGLEDRPSTRR